MKTSMVAVLPIFRRTFRQNGHSKETSKLFVGLTEQKPSGIYQEVSTSFLHWCEENLWINEDRFDAAQRAVEKHGGRIRQRSELSFAGTVTLEGKDIFKLYVYRWNINAVSMKSWEDNLYEADGRSLYKKADGHTISILPSSKHWLLHFLFTDRRVEGLVRVDSDFSVREVEGRAHALLKYP